MLQQSGLISLHFRNNDILNAEPLSATYLPSSSDGTKVRVAYQVYDLDSVILRY